ncbi:type IX secretion system membrane protein PorP/SprF [Flavobacteriaceae bacterium]|nr:type IX secretion system membrane protein PorP/SprF [Flavobacteriaceae bacterium]
MKNKISIILLLMTLSLQAQEDYFVGHTRFFQKVNASYFGFNNLNRVGVLYNTVQLNSNQNIDNKYFFGGLSFDEKSFSLGIDFNSFHIDRPGIIHNTGTFSYVYKVQLNDALFFLPAISLGSGSIQYNTGSFIFEDQLDQATGFINIETNDPSGIDIRDTNYFDIGASFIIHNEDFMVGLSIKNLNRPNISLNPEAEELKNIKYTLSGAYEFNINQLERGFFPKHSYLLSYGSFTKVDEALYIYFSQEIQLGEFSLGLSQQASNFEKLNLNNIGMSVGLSLENFDFGILYNFPIRNVSKVYSPSIFEIYLTFDFSKYKRNSRGLYKRFQTDNYF